MVLSVHVDNDIVKILLKKVFEKRLLLLTHFAPTPGKRERFCVVLIIILQTIVDRRHCTFLRLAPGRWIGFTLRFKIFSFNKTGRYPRRFWSAPFSFASRVGLRRSAVPTSHGRLCRLQILFSSIRTCGHA